jgi:hypothetical protein
VADACVIAIEVAGQFNKHQLQLHTAPFLEWFNKHILYSEHSKGGAWDGTYRPWYDIASLERARNVKVARLVPTDYWVSSFKARGNKAAEEQFQFKVQIGRAVVLDLLWVDDRNLMDFYFERKMALYEYIARAPWQSYKFTTPPKSGAADTVLIFENGLDIPPSFIDIFDRWCFLPGIENATPREHALVNVDVAAFVAEGVIGPHSVCLKMSPSPKNCPQVLPLLSQSPVLKEKATMLIG